MKILIAESDEALEICFAVVQQLRPHLTLNNYLSQVRRQQKKTGYQIAYVQVDGRVVATAGYLFRETLGDGLFLNVDDLVTDQTERSKGYGATLIAYLYKIAKENGCATIQLDSAVHRADAHRFYDREGYRVTARHFAFFLSENADGPDRTK